ncbi:MAG: UDP-N-acetylglucosamine--N-acetylmuramyl-(pentapeptide) pyrophosphoryl-undecaprenol N-acetylglucosamine transferase, partial [Lentisphaerae bacterium]
MDEAKPILANKTVGIACGGTGGHFYPGASIGRYCQNQGAKVVLMLGGHRIDEQTATARNMGFEPLRVPAERLPQSKLGYVGFCWRFFRNVLYCWKMLKENQVDLVVGMGSWASVPVCVAANWAGIPLILHEGNIHMGQANRFLAKYARVIGYSFPGTNIPATSAKHVRCGMPLREEIRLAVSQQEKSRAELREAFCREHGFEPGNPIILVFGGSQGAKVINETVEKMLPIIRNQQRPWQFIHLTGSSDNYDLRERYQTYYILACVAASDPEIHKLYPVADLVVCRAGASSVFELAAFRKPAILIPFAGAKESHQEANAAYLAAEGAAEVIRESELNAELLFNQIDTLLN